MCAVEVSNSSSVTTVTVYGLNQGLIYGRIGRFSLYYSMWVEVVGTTCNEPSGSINWGVS